jgi:hypothetical protein
MSVKVGPVRARAHEGGRRTSELWAMVLAGSAPVPEPAPRRLDRSWSRESGPSPKSSTSEHAFTSTVERALRLVHADRVVAVLERGDPREGMVSALATDLRRAAAGVPRQRARAARGAPRGPAP